MAENWKTVWSELVRMFGGNGIWILFLAALVYLFFSGKDLRRKVAWPALILCVLVIEPHIYQYIWSRLLGDTYWRALWLIPIIPVIACAVTDLVRRIQRKTLAALALGGMLLLIAGCGTYIYGEPLTSFGEASNPYKLPQSAVDVCDFLLEQEETPRVVVGQSLYNYVRQYSADIQMMYGRDAEGYINYITEERKAVASEMNSDSPDLLFIHDAMEKMNYSYLVRSDYDESQDEIYVDAGFEKIGMVDGYGIFRRV